jgi:multiple sugar transport system ATP-binding protein
MAVVVTRKLKKHFGNVHAVDGIDIEIRDGEFLALLGPSGSGKSTLMRMIAGLDYPTSGEIRIDDIVVNDLPPRKRHIAMVFQSYALYPHMTVYKNIAFPLKPMGLDKKEMDSKVAWAARMFDIERLLDRKPRQLSGGERQRVALARAIVREPKVFLLDEPLSNLDAKLRAMARDELKQFQREIGVTTIYVTHDQVEAMGMGDRVAVMYEGELRQLGTPEELYRKPADTFVAGFLGSPPMNLIPRKDVIMGFHPEHFLPKGIRQDVKQPVSMPFKITRVEYLGSDRFLYGFIHDTEGEAKIVAKLPSLVDMTIEAGQTYDFVVDHVDVNYFDKTTGKRLDPQPAMYQGAQ